MNLKSNSYIFLLVSILKCCIAFTLALYLALLGISIFHMLNSSIFYFDFRGELMFSLKKGLFFGIIFGIGEWAMRKAKESEKDKK